MGREFFTGLVVLMVTLSAQANRISAEQFGLTPETGYLYAVEAADGNEVCNPNSDILLSSVSLIQYIHKCDSSIIGWVERDASGADLRPNGMGFDLMTNSVGQQEAINLYTCGHSRDDDLAKDPRYTASRDTGGNFLVLTEVMKQKRPFRIQLFYNEYVLSGKCIGAIEVY